MKRGREKTLFRIRDVTRVNPVLNKSKVKPKFREGRKKRKASSSGISLLFV